jgi:D-arginine dehydrogenase
MLGRARDEGVRLITAARVEAIETDDSGVAAVRTSVGRFKAATVVNAAGAWAPEVARMAGAGGRTLEVFRRHLFFTGRFSAASHDLPLPFLWDIDVDVYLRAHGEELMLCPCDHEPHDASPPTVSPQASVLLQEKLAAAMPAASRLPVREGRACLRTFARDSRYLIGPDPRVEGFFWVAGLGGSGATAGMAAGELAAARLAGRPVPEPLAAVLPHVDPARFGHE